MEYAEELLAIECVTMLFWDYTDEDIQALKSGNRDFAYVWDNYLDDKSGQDSFNALWDCWMLKFSIETKLMLIRYAVEKYGEEKRDALEHGYSMSRFFKNFGGENA